MLKVTDTKLLEKYGFILVNELFDTWEYVLYDNEGQENGLYLLVNTTERRDNILRIYVYTYIEPTGDDDYEEEQLSYLPRVVFDMIKDGVLVLG